MYLSKFSVEGSRSASLRLGPFYFVVDKMERYKGTWSTEYAIVMVVHDFGVSLTGHAFRLREGSKCDP